MEPDEHILIGFVDERIKDEANLAEAWKLNKVGGCPSFSPSVPREKVAQFLQRDAVCSSCGKKLGFLAQIYCPVDDSSFDRVLYFFFCTHKECESPGWRAFRCVSEAVVVDTVKCNDGLDWSSNLDDWGEESEQTVDIITSGADAKPVVVDSNLCAFDAHFINVEEEKYVVQTQSSGLKEDMGSCSNEPDSFAPEAYEKTDVSKIYNNRTAYKFYKRIASCPQQIIRYNWKGLPLRINEDDVQPEGCKSCGSSRTFEMQFMPALLAVLKPKTEVFNFDFGTLLVYTCKENCNVDSIQREEIVVSKDAEAEILTKEWK